MANIELEFSANVDEWKLVFRSLHAHLTEHLELMDCELFEQLQQRLQAAAKVDGIDVTDHAAWDAWLGNKSAPTCEERVALRKQTN